MTPSRGAPFRGFRDDGLDANRWRISPLYLKCVMTVSWDCIWLG